MAEARASRFPAVLERRDVGLAVILAFGGSLYLAHLDHAITSEESLQAILLGVFVPALSAVAIIAVATWLWLGDVDGVSVGRIAVWCVIGGAVVAGGAALTVLYEAAEGVRMSDPLWVVLNAASGGGVVGIVIGFYEGRQRHARRRAARREQQLTVLDRLLRHDLRNAANVISGRAELIADGDADPAEQAAAIQDQAMELVELGERARRLEAMLREDDVDRERLELTGLVESSCEAVRRDYPEREVTATLPDHLEVRAHPLLESAIANVIDNAAAHNDAAEPRVEVEIDRVTRNGRPMVDLRVADNGPGIPSTEVDVLDRGYETPLAHSTGLGLWVVDWIVTASGGDVAIETAGDRGSVVHLYLEPAGA